MNNAPLHDLQPTPLTANGTDSLAIKKVVVTDNLTVKASVVAQQDGVRHIKGYSAVVLTGTDALRPTATKRPTASGRLLSVKTYGMYNPL